MKSTNQIQNRIRSLEERQSPGREIAHIYLTALEPVEVYIAMTTDRTLLVIFTLCW